MLSEHHGDFSTFQFICRNYTLNIILLCGGFLAFLYELNDKVVCVGIWKPERLQEVPVDRGCPSNEGVWNENSIQTDGSGERSCVTSASDLQMVPVLFYIILFVRFSHSQLVESMESSGRYVCYFDPYYGLARVIIVLRKRSDLQMVQHFFT